MMKRRSFVPAAAAAFGFQIVRPGVLRAQGAEKTPNEKIRLAVIGCGGQGGADLGGMAHEAVVALCDVDDRRAADSFGKHPQAKRYKDFRKMFAEMADGIDAVLVATPDHTHFTAAMTAMRAGKHVYCEKPLAHSVAELRTLRKTALEKKVVTQVGNQGHSSASIRGLVEMVRSGAIGNVTEIHAGCDAFKDVYAQQGRMAELAQHAEVPNELDWNLWQGPVAERSYHPGFLPFSWRGHMAYGGGCMGDWVCHVVDPSFWALDLDMPTAVTAEVTKDYDPKLHAMFYPRGTRITFEFPAKGARGPVKLIWHDGEFSIPAPKELEEEGQGRKVVGTGAVLIGDKGKIMHGSHGAGGWRIIPVQKAREIPKPDETIPRVKDGNHQQDWLDAVRAGRPAGSPFEYGGALSEIGLLGVVATRFPGERLVWDAGAMQFTGHEAATALARPASWRAEWDGVRPA